MEHQFIVVLAGLTSLAAYVGGIKGFGLSGRGLRVALYTSLECVAAMIVFLLVNLALGLLAVLTKRVLTGEFVFLYLAADIMLVVLSFLQALIF